MQNCFRLMLVLLLVMSQSLCELIAGQGFGNHRRYEFEKERDQILNCDEMSVLPLFMAIDQVRAESAMIQTQTEVSLAGISGLCLRPQQLTKAPASSFNTFLLDE